MIVDGSGNTVASGSAAHAADLPAGPGLSEQDPGKLLESARSVVAGLPAAARHAVAGVGLAGQMHGVLLLDRQGNPVGPLVTWQDARCSMEFLAGLRAATGYQLRTGFGCATLAWYAAAAKLPPAASYAATIHDWIAARLCGLARPVTDPTDAASWGLFDLGRVKARVRAEQALQAAVSLAESPAAPRRLSAAIRYSVFPGGARIRPRLCLAVAAACGEDHPAPADGAVLWEETADISGSVSPWAGEVLVNDRPAEECSALRRSP